MKKTLLTLFLLLGALPAFAQNPTAVTGIITDSNLVPYFPATVTACLSPVTSNPIVNGVSVNPNIGTNYCVPTANTASTGFFSMSLFPNAAITPAATQWQFTVTTLGSAPPAGKGPQTFQVNITISGTSQNVGATLTAAAPTLLNSGGGGGGGAALPTANLVSQLALTEGVGNPTDSKAGVWALASGLSAPSWNVPLASDNALGSALGPAWSSTEGTIIEASGTFRISVVGASTFADAFYQNATFSPDQYSQVTQSVASTSTVRALGVAVRLRNNSGNIDGYICYNSSTTMFLAKRSSGATTVLQQTARTPAAGDILRIQVTGEGAGQAEICTITTSGNVATTLSATDTLLTTGAPGLFGIGVFAADPSATNWFAGNVTAPAGGGLYFAGGQFATAPSSLNSVREWDVYLCYQRNSNSNAYNSILQGNGNGAASNANGFGLTGQPNLSNGPVQQQLPHLSVLGGSNYNAMVPYSNFNGCGVATITFGSSTDGTQDSTYINNIESLYTNEFHTQSAGLQTVGAYQLGGAAAGSGFATVSFLTGAVYYVAGYSTPNSIAQRAQVVQAITQAVVNRGGPAPFLGDTARGDTCVTDGDSITNGFNVSNGLVWTQNLTFFTPTNGSTFNSGGTSCWNQGVTATTMKQLDSKVSITSAPLFSTSARNVVVLWAGTNDMLVPTACGISPTCYGATAGQVLQSMKHYADQLRVPNGFGAKVIVVSMLSRRAVAACDADVNKDAFNPLLRNWWATFADGFVDLGESTIIGADNTCTTSAFSDFTHPSAGSQLNVISPQIERSINMLYGNNDFTSATTYVAAATAAVATTAGSEAANTMTFTFGATPANCQNGNIITIAGVTPAGYNGNWLIRTRSATQVTAYNDATGLGAISVQGTGICPQQQDQDVYQILNFGAGNYTLETCGGMTGQNIYIKNINAATSTLVPFGTETIDGAANLAIAQNAMVVLQSQLTSNTAGGCSWKKLQNN